MKRYVILGTVLFSVIFSICHAAISDPCYVSNHLLVRFVEEGVSSASDAARLAVVQAAGGGTIEKMYTIVPGLGLVKLPEGVQVSSAQAAFASTVGVRYAEPNYEYSIWAVPNDSDFSLLWGMNNTGQTGGLVDADIDAPEAWNIATGDGTVIVAVTDTGVDYTHPDLVDNLWVNEAELNGTEGVDDDGNGYVDDIYGIDTINGDSDPMDDHGHGTHCSGTIGGVGDNGIGVAGVCWTVQLMELKCFDASGSGNTASEIEAIEYARNMGANVISAPWGGYGYSDALYDVIEQCLEDDILFVAAAGNEYNDNDTSPAYPASYDLDNIISVLATNDADEKASFSNWGVTTVDLGAPGVDIYSTAPGGGYQYMSGTSMACPHVAGAAALVWSAQPSLTAADVKEMLMSSVDQLDSLNGLCLSGGRLNLYNAMLLLLRDSFAPTPNPAQWDIEPAATGLHHIVMKATNATDVSGVEYYFDCLEDDTFDSIQDDRLYIRTDYAAGTTYTFRVLARDKSDNQNETEWSEEISTTTSATVDDLPPAPGPDSVWGAKPRKYTIRRDEETIFMQAAQFYDESGLEYFFDCIATTDPGILPDDLDRVQTTRDYLIDPAFINDGYRYTFRLVVRDGLGNALQASSPATVSFETDVNPQVLKVPLIYPTIQDAIDAAIDGDVVELQANRVYTGADNRNLDFGGKAITVRSENPEDPDIVASTIIDCQGTQDAGMDNSQRRAFIFQNGEDPNSVVSGLTIINAYAVNNPKIVPSGSDPNGLDAQGGAILCLGSSPTISRCVIRNCYAQGQDSTPGVDGTPGTPGMDGVDGNPGGTDGTDGGDASSGAGAGSGFGGALYADLMSSPFIVNCTIENTQAIGGDGGFGGSGGAGGNGGNAYVPSDPNFLVDANGGNGGNGGDGADGGAGGIGVGGAFFFEGQSQPRVYHCTIINCSALAGTAGIAGSVGGAAGIGGTAAGNGMPGTDGQPGLDGSVEFEAGTSGGAFYFGEQSNPTLLNNDIQNCRATENGGAIYLSENSNLLLQGCDVADCNTVEGSAVFIGTESMAVFINSTFTGNFGAKATVFADPNSILQLTNSLFSGNLSTGIMGGALYAYHTTELTIDTCVFNSNSSAGSGGAIYAYDTDAFHVMDSEFNGNIVSGGGDGGAIYYRPELFNSTVEFEITKCTFSLNTAGIDSDPTQSSGEDTYGNGGAICINPNWMSYEPLPAISITDCTFTQNNADTGGAVFTWFTNVLIDNCTFSGNISEYGGGVFWYDADLTITNSSFDNNLAENTDGPAGASSGGALYCLDASARVYNCKFAENGAELSGGAMSFVGSFMNVPGGTQDMINCLMVENTAVDSGGAISVVDGAEPFMINCTMAGNMTTGMAGFGGAVSCTYDGNPQGATYALLENSIVWDNLAEFGPQAAVGDPMNMYNQLSMLELYYSDIQGGTDDVFLGSPAGNTAVYASGGVIDMDPLFVQATDPDETINRTYYLQQVAGGQLVDSPCVVYAGIDSVDDLEVLLAFEVTTKTNHGPDDGFMDMGFHYDASLPVLSYTLTTSVYIADYYPHGTISPSPGEYTVTQGSIIELVAVPESDAYRVARWIGTDDDTSVELTNTITMSGDRTVQVEFELAVPKNLYVPETYDTIEEALEVARSGDTIILTPRPDSPYLIANPDGINFGGKQLVITSTDPDNPSIVASTIINCQGSRYISKRAFHFENGEDSSSRIEGITIRNAFTAEIGLSNAISTGYWPWPFENPPDPLPPLRGLSGMDATGDSYGGAILCENGSSPTIRNCVFENCTVSGGVGGDGEDGYWPANMINVTGDLDSQSGGHSGKGTGDGYGGAIAVMSGSSPQILNCTFKNNRATGGWGGIPGDAGTSYNNGRYGWGGNDWNGIYYAYYSYGINLEAGYGEGDGHGGAIFVATGCMPQISQCTFEGNYARPGYVSPGGSEGAGDAYPEPWDADPWGQAGMREGRDGILITNGTIAGGAIFFEQDANVTLEGCRFVENEAYEVTGIEDEFDPRITTRGGAVYSNPNAIIKILPLRDENDPTVIVSESVFTGNMAGALYCATGVDLRVEQTMFTNNSSYYPIDEISFIDRLLLGLTESEPTGNYDIGGAITVEVDAAVSSQILDCQFLGNTSHVGGGAIRTDSDMTLWDSVLNGNRSQDNGGAFYSYVPVYGADTHTTKLTFENCELSGNDAKGLGGGGAGFVKNCILTMNNCFLIENTAFSGGALRVSVGDFVMKGTLVYGNDATGVIAGSHLTVTEEGFGGGLHITDTPFSIVDTRFENNSAQGIISAGGGLCITGSQTYYEQTLLNCLFANNHSDNIGGGAACQLYVNVNIDNCTFADNSSGGNLGGALYVNHLSNAILNNSIVSGNTGIGIYEKESGDTQVSYSLFYNNQGGDMHNGSDEVVYSAASAPGYSNIENGDPKFVTGPLGMYYLNQVSSPAVDTGSMTASSAGLNTFTTDPAGMLDQGVVDLGYHYDDPDGIDEFTLNASVMDENGVVGEAGTVTPNSGSYLRGAVLQLSADVDDEYFLTGWSGGTFDDNSQEAVNTVLMARDKDITVLVRMRKTLSMGASSEYDTLGDAIDDAQDGDIILVTPGEYTAPSQYPSTVNYIILDGKKITISGANPDDEAVVRSTVFRDYSFVLINLDDQTIIEGIALNQSRMLLEDADPIIRNCVFSECRFSSGRPDHVGDVPDGTDGYNAYPMFGGAIRMLASSPKINNCTFENNAAFGVDGENGFDGGDNHPNGGDGGWPSPTYGGAVYCGLSSNPEFVDCTFTGNEVIGGNGGNGADYVTVDGVDYYGGRGGGWVYDEFNEQILIDVFDWDGWVFGSYGDKYTIYSIYADFYGEYDIDLWAKWFNWGDSYSTWDEFFSDYASDPYDPLGDPHDQMMDAWRYSAYGGAVYCELDCDITFKGCVFEDNQSHGGLTGIGGAHPPQYRETPWPDRQLNMPTAGGAVFAANDSDLVFENCKFKNNTADISTVDLPHTFQVSFGGAVAYEFDCEVSFTGCDILENNATVGGGIYGYDSMVEIADCNVFDNEAYLGAGIYLDDESAVISGTRVHANRAKSPDVVIEPPDEDPPDDEPVVPLATLDQTGEGAGIYAHVLDLQIRDSIFVENQAQISGGGLMLSGTVDDSSDIFNCLFAQNRASRDGGGASVTWSSIATFTNCTFADNDSWGSDMLGYIGSGGGLYCAYDSAAEVLDSIFWGNGASQGAQIAVATSERPSQLTVKYTNIAGFPSANAIYVASGCDLDIEHIFNNSFPDPDDAFLTLPGAPASDVSAQYYLDQDTSPWKDAGSRTSIEAGLNEYTTSIYGVRDKGVVDLGYHYLVSYRSECGAIDEALILDGQIDLADLVAFVDEWLNAEVCAEGNNWCDGSDLNYDGEVNLDDMASVSACWLVEDTEIPYPSPAEWQLQPKPVAGTFDEIEMAAIIHHDAWWPDEFIRYQFYYAYTDDESDPIVLYVDQDTNHDGWLTFDELDLDSMDQAGETVIRIYATASLNPAEGLSFYVYVLAEDGSGNQTALSERTDNPVTLGANEIPDAQWLTVPYNTVINPGPDAEIAVGMEARTYESLPDALLPLPDGYVARYQLEKDGVPGSYQDSPAFVDTDIIEGSTYTYAVRIGIFAPGDPQSVTTSGLTPEYPLTIVAVDLIPPVPTENQDPTYPYKAQHASSGPVTLYRSQDSQWYNIVEAVEAEDAESIDPTDVEYKFVCNDSAYSSGGSQDPDSLVWRNRDNTAGLFYPDGSAQVPYRYMVSTGVIEKPNLVWYIFYRDRSPNQNVGDSSDGWSAAGPNPVVVVNPPTP